jgi:hypothetical protein
MLHVWIAGLGLALHATAALADISADLALCRDYNTPSAQRLEACSAVIAQSQDAHAQFHVALDSQWASDFPAACFDVEPWEKRRKLVNWPRCEKK